MIFQTLKSVVKTAYYYDGKLNGVAPLEGATWDCFSNLSNRTLFASVLCENHPEKFIDVSEYSASLKNLRLHLKTLKEAKIDLSKNAWFDLIPKKPLYQFLDAKNKMTESISALLPKTENYQTLVDLVKVLEDIEKRKVYDNRSIKYLMFKSRTGRLTTGKNSFPILTLQKANRGVIKPLNDFFLSLDYNAFDIRVFLGLCGVEQPLNDIHQYHCDSVFEINDRAEAKQRFFRWLYNAKMVDEQLGEKYNKRDLLKKYYHDGIVKTPYGKEIEADENHALPYLVQSTAASLFFQRVSDIHKLLKGRKSEIMALLHDELVIDFSRKDIELLAEIRNKYQETKYGRFLTRVKVGKNFGDMKNWKIEVD